MVCVCVSVVHSVKLSRSHVDWHNVDEIYLYSDATTSKIARTVTQKLGFSKGESVTFSFFSSSFFPSPR